MDSIQKRPTAARWASQTLSKDLNPYTLLPRVHALAVCVQQTHGQQHEQQQRQRQAWRDEQIGWWDCQTDTDTMVASLFCTPDSDLTARAAGYKGRL